MRHLFRVKNIDQSSNGPLKKEIWLVQKSTRAVTDWLTLNDKAWLWSDLGPIKTDFLSLPFHYNTKKSEFLSGVEHNVYWLTVINGLQYRQVPSNKKLLQRVINPWWPAPSITNMSRQRILEMLEWYFWWEGNAYDNSLEKGQPSEISP